jgi:hypothetical protein
MKIGFFVWNPFQVYQFESVVQSLPGEAVYILERRKNVDFDRLFPKDFVASLSAPIHFVKRGELAEIDGEYDAVVCQTAFGHMERLVRTKVVGLQYSMSKERHQYGPWRLLCDLNLVYGQYSYDRVSPYSPCVSVGNPRFDRWFSQEFDLGKTLKVQERLDPNKKTILYMPTWGALSSMTVFGEAIARLADDYNVIAKVHHKTDSHEMSRKMSLTEQGVQDIFGASDDMLHLLREADLVLSDFSGAIFDALNVGKPVILLQQNPERLAEMGAEKFGLESIEYAHRDMIGPVVSDPADLARTVTKVLGGEADFIEKNRALKQQCFSAERNCGELAAKAIRDLVAGKYAERPYHQIYMRDMLREQRIEEENRKGLSITKVVQKVAAASHSHSSSRRHFRGLMLKGAVKAIDVAFSGLLITCTEKTIRVFIKSTDVALADRTVPTPILWISRLLYSGHLVELGKRFDDQSTSHLARWLMSQAFRKSRSTGLTPYLNILIRYQRIAEIKRLIDCLLALPVSARVHVQSRLERAIEYSKSHASVVRQSRTEVYHYILDKLINTSSHTPEQTLDRALLISLTSNRWLDEASTFLLGHKISDRTRARISGDIEVAKNRMGKWFFLTALANNNHRPDLQAGQFQAFIKGNVLDVAALPADHIVEFFLPPYFYSNSVTDPAVHARICRVLIDLLEQLSELGIAIVPRHQFRLSDAFPSGHWPVISYHTTANQAQWWHVKDGPIPAYFSMDPLGYSGWASLASITELPTEEIAEADIEAAWHKLQASIVEQKASKYPQGCAHFSPPTRPFVFLPLQVLDDTVAQLAYIPADQLLGILIRELPALGYDLVVKRHPKCQSKKVARMLDNTKNQPHVTITNCSIHEIIHCCTAVVTVNSGVGFESLLHLKRVILTGKADYAFATTAVQDDTALMKALEEISLPPDIARIKRFVYHYTMHHLFHMDDAASIRMRLMKFIG